MNQLHIGFTGTRRGMTLKQRIALGDVLIELKGDPEIKPGLRMTGHHGDCVGAPDGTRHEEQRINV